ncbi:MAG TPA: IS6 family transposase [Candidatus Binatia bacterium]|nr:IS6 family transposase [Candidatus Binatia bacterium]
MNLFSNDQTTFFKRCHFDSSLIIRCVRWYLTYKLSYRDLVAIMAERNVDVAHTTIMRWVQRYVPEFEKRWQRYAHPVGTSWRVDETYLKVKGKWGYLYRAVDSAGQTVDFLLSEHRDRAAAKRFLVRAIEKRDVSEKITLDGYAASHEAVAELQEEDGLPADLTVRTSRYLNNVIEQDHRRVKQRVRPMLGFKCFAPATITIGGIELVYKLRKSNLTFRCSASLRYELHRSGRLC